MTAPWIPPSQAATCRPQPSPLLSLPTELHQSIFLHCFEPNLPRASPILRRSLSSEFVYKLSFLHAFWSSTPVEYRVLYGKSPHTYEPGPHIRSLFKPLPVLRKADADEQEVFQSTVLSYRWCTFSRARRYFSDIMEAVTKDLLLTFDPPFSEQDCQRLVDVTSQLPIRFCAHEATARDGSQLSLTNTRRLDTAIYATYRGTDPRFDRRITPNLEISPTHVWAIPDICLLGRPYWTDAKIDLLRTLRSHINLREVKYSLSAFHEGMKNAILQGKEEALLVLVWYADQLTGISDKSRNSCPFEPPADLYRVAATQCLLQGKCEDPLPDDADRRIDFSTSVSMFKLLVRAHAESIPLEDKVITAWAMRLREWQHGTESQRAFGQWVLDYEKKRTSEYKFEHPWGGDSVRRPLFHYGLNSDLRWDDPMLRRFVEINGGELKTFYDEADEINRAIGTDGE